jgi:hypothetical protein
MVTGHVTHLYRTTQLSLRILRQHTPVLRTCAKAHGQTEWDPIAWGESYFEPTTTLWALPSVTTATSRHLPVLCRSTLITLSPQVTQHCRRYALKGAMHRWKSPPSFVNVNKYESLTLYRTWSLYTPPVWTFRSPVVNEITYSIDTTKVWFEMCLYMCSKCFGLYSGHPQACQQKNLIKDNIIKSKVSHSPFL